MMPSTRRRERSDPGLVRRFAAWMHQSAAHLREGSDLVETVRGAVECSRGCRRAPLVVGVHGSPGGYDQIAAAFLGFPGAGFDLMTWSRPGYLRTSLDLGRSFEEQADLMAALLDTIGLDRVAIFGFSGGGPVAVHFAARYPGRVWALILESAVTHRLSWPRVWAFESVLGNWLWNLAACLYPRAAFSSVVHGETQLDAELANDLLERALHDERRARMLRGLLGSASPAVLRRAGLANDAVRISRLEPLPCACVTAPTLILHGARDPQVPLEHAERAARLLPRAELVRVPEAIHFLSLAENADEIASLRIEFLRRHAPPRPPTGLGPRDAP